MANDLSVIVMSYNNGKRILEFDDELTKMLIGFSMNTEVVYVDNGSTDDTVYHLRKRLADPVNSVTKKMVLLRRNYGMSSAFMAGADHSDGQFIATIDANMVYDPVDILRLISEVENGYDVVVGWRQRGHLGTWSQQRSKLANWFTSSITGLRLRDYGSTFRVYTRDIIPDLNIYGDLYQFAPVFAFRSGARISEIPVSYRPSYYTGWEYTPGSLWVSFLDVLTVWFISRYASRPIHIFGSIGFGIIAIAGIVLSYAFYNRWVNAISLIETPLPVLSGVLLAVGVLTIMLGMTTEIVTRAYVEAQGKASYSVREIIDLESKS